MRLWPFIEAEKAEQLNVKRACELLEVSRAAFYEFTKHEPSARELSDAELKRRIRAVYEESKGTYGAPRIARELRDQGVHVAKKRVARLMVEQGLAGRCRRRWRKTTIADPDAETTAVDLIGRRFGPGLISTLAGAATSPTSPPGRAGRTWPPSSTSPAAVSSAGHWPTTCAPALSPTPSPWPAPAAGPRPG